MNKTLRYQYDGHDIVVNYNNRQLASSYIQPEDVSLYVDGKRCDLTVSIGFSTKQLPFMIVDTEAHIKLSQHGFNHYQSIVVGDEKLTPTEAHEKKNMKLDHLEMLSQYAPIAQLTYADFLALKCADPKAISYSGNRSQFYLRLNKDAAFPGLDNDCRLESKGFRQGQRSDQNFVKIAWADIRPGDDIVVAEQTNMGQQIITLVENVSHKESFNCDHEFNPDRIGVLEGANTTWTSFYAQRHFENKVLPEIESAGIRTGDVAAIFKSITFDEFQTTQEIFQHGVAFNDRMFKDLVKGKSVQDVIDAEFERLTWDGHDPKHVPIDTSNPNITLIDTSKNDHDHVEIAEVEISER